MPATALVITPPQRASVDVLTTSQHAPIDEHPATVYLASLRSAQSRRTMRICLNEIAYVMGAARTGKSITQDTAFLFVDWGALRFQHTSAIRAQIGERFALHHANKILYALRGVLKAARNLGQMNSDDYVRAVSFRPIQGETLPRGRALSVGEIVALLAACAADPSAAGARDGTMIALLSVGGLRRAEICGLALEDIDTTSDTLRILGKGNKERSIPLIPGALDALEDWIAVRGNAPGSLFHPVNKAGEIVRSSMTPQAVYNVLTKRAAEAHVKGLSPHDFRRTLIGDLLGAGADIVTVQKIVGHANVQTTARYDRRGETAKRSALNLLHLPYSRRKSVQQPSLGQ